MTTLSVRRATPEDLPAIRRHDPDFPQVDDQVVLECFVVENSDGEIVGSFCFEKSVRLCILGTSPEILAGLHDIQQQVFETSKEAGLRFMHCLVSKTGASSDLISSHLQEAGFTRRDDLIEHVLDLRQLKDGPCEPLPRPEVDVLPAKWLM